jgi:hypothetical protein
MVTGAKVAGTKAPSIVHDWIEYASTTTSTSFGKLTASWVVPPVPKSNDGQIIYFFPGMEDTNDTASIIQPVLQYGDGAAGGGNYWAIASWNCCVTGTTFFSTLKNVNPGDTIVGTIQSTCAAGVLSCGSWNITTADQTLGTSTTLPNSSSDGQTFNWAFAGALEVYSVVKCTDYPPNAPMFFSAVALYDYNFSQIGSPAWSVTNASAGLAPQCEYGGAVDSATKVALNYGATAWLPGVLQALLQ